MRKIFVFVTCTVLFLFLFEAVHAEEDNAPKPKSGFWSFFFGSNEESPKGTHHFAESIRVPVEDKTAEIQTFCIDKKGRLLVAAGGTQFDYVEKNGQYDMVQVDSPASIHVFSPEGKPETVWKLEVTPQALAVGPDNSVFVAGMGQVVKLDENGKILQSIESPHVKNLPPLPPIPDEKDDDETAKAKEARLKRIKEIEKEIVSLREKINKGVEELTKAQQSKNADVVAKAEAEFEKIAEPYSKLYEEKAKLSSTKRQIAINERNSILRSKGVRSIAVTDKYVFVCTPPSKGYATEVWRMNSDFSEPTVVVKNLSGCCGQMNINAFGDKLVIPENGRMKVHVYDADGKLMQSWGKGEREDAKAGFGSCCNPMNIAFDDRGNVLTSEASVGAIKRFTQEGKFLELVCQSKIVPGCKHTPIGMSLDGKSAYMLDITRREILVLKQKP